MVLAPYNTWVAPTTDPILVDNMFLGATEAEAINAKLRNIM